MSLFNYLQEHYNFNDVLLAEELYRKHLDSEGVTMIEKPYGFINYMFKGDACIIKDIYTTQESRKTGKAWDLFLAVKKVINKNPNCKVIIGFTEHGTNNTQDGVGAMLAAGFKPAYTLVDKTVYIRGTH